MLVWHFLCDFCVVCKYYDLLTYSTVRVADHTTCDTIVLNVVLPADSRFL